MRTKEEIVKIMKDRLNEEQLTLLEGNEWIEKMAISIYTLGNGDGRQGRNKELKPRIQSLKHEKELLYGKLSMIGDIIEDSRYSIDKEMTGYIKVDMKETDGEV